MDREGFEPSISPMPRAYPTSLDDRPNNKLQHIRPFRISTKQLLGYCTEITLSINEELAGTHFCETY